MNLFLSKFRMSVTFTLSFLMTAFLFSQEKIAKEIHETYPLNNQSSLTIQNKYGKIDLMNWDKNSVDVKVQIVLNDVNDEQAEEILNAIQIEYGTEGNSIYFKTVYDEKLSKNIFRFNDGGKKFEVNYIVQMPHSLLVDIKNKYGDVFIEKLSSASQIDVKYGNLKANNISSESKDPMAVIYLSYSEANIETCSWLKVNSKYSKCRINSSKALIIVSKYSKFHIERGSSIVTESKYDEYDVGDIANFVTDASYGNFKFNSIGKKLQMETNYTDVKVGYVPASFEMIKVSNRYGSYKVGIENGSSYQLKGYAKYGDIKYPDNSRVSRFQETTELSLEGFVGSNEKAQAKVIVDTKYGSIDLAD